MQPTAINQQSILQCFKAMTSSIPNPTLQKQADTYLSSCQQSCTQFITILLTIFQSQQNQTLKLQSLICFSNVIKRNYLNKKIKDSTLPNFEKLKTSIKDKLIEYLVNAPGMYRKTLLDIVVFIAHIDYPHNFEQLIGYMEGMIDNVQDVDFLKENLKALGQVYKRKQKKGVTLAKKHFEASSLKILAKLYNISENLFENIETLDEKQHSLLRSIMKLKLLFLTTAPNDIVDNQQLIQVVETVYLKLQNLLLKIIEDYDNNATKNTNSSSTFQKEHLLKSIIQYMSYLQYKHPLALILCFGKYLHALIHIINNYTKFVNQLVLKYAIIALTKVLKSYIYYSSQNQFMLSSHSKSKYINFIPFRTQIHKEYREIINEQNVSEILSKVISEVMSLKDYDSFDEGVGVEDEEGKMDEKESSLQRLALGLLEALINRFPAYSYGLIESLVNSCISTQFANMDKSMIINLLNVCSILPAALRGNNNQLLDNFPIQSLISFAYNSNNFPDKFALLSCKWIHKFSHQQTAQIVNALLTFIDSNSNSVSILLECCLAIKTIILNKSQELDLSSAVQKIIPVAIKLFSTTESVQILWPMITLISKLISSVECNIVTLQNALACNSLANLLQTQEELIIEALCQMFRTILCTLPRDQPQPVTYNLILAFLSNQLMKTHIAGYEEVLKLWYLTVREYDRLQGKDNELKILFEKYYILALQSTFNEKLLYILQEYVLLNLIQTNIQAFTKILGDFYEHGGSEETTEDDRYKLRIAAVSVHITFISKFGIGDAHSSQLLIKYLDDLIETTNNSVPNKLADTFKTSLMTVINRYIILFKPQFFEFLAGTNKYSFNLFLRAWFTGMQSLTSKTACKINAIASLYMMQDLEPGLLKNRFQYIMKKIIPQIMEALNVAPFLAKVGVSPTYRMSENILSQRKENIRREGVFEEINLKVLFGQTVKNLISKNLIDQQFVENTFGADKSLLESFYMLVS